MQITTLEKELSGCSYPGRGIVIGRSADGTKAVTAYFIMGRSVNSRNRVFVEDKEGIRTEAFDPSKLEDPSLIIYAPVRVLGKKTIVTNGDQTDTVYDLMSTGKTFEESLRTREFEPPGCAIYLTPLLYALSILSPNGKNASEPSATFVLPSSHALFSSLVNTSGFSVNTLSHAPSSRISIYSSPM